MNIAVLDGRALEPLSWERLAKHGKLSVYSSTAPEEVVERARGNEALIVNKIVLGEKELSELPCLRYIGITATGFNIIDLEACKKRGVTVTNVPAYSTEAVAESVFSFILSYAHRPVEQSALVKEGKWSGCGFFTYFSYPLYELKGKTLGIIGMGNIGRRVAAIADAFGMNVLYNARSPKKGVPGTFASLDELLPASDFVTLHTALTPETKEIINKDSLSKMKRSAMLINTARGPLVNEEDLYDALRDGTIAFAALDVMGTEPPALSPLFTLDNIYITPHVAWAPLETRTRLQEVVFSNFEAWLEGRSVNVVS